MTDRGLPIVDGAPACPFVAFEDDRDGRGLAPDHRHRCYAEPRPAPRALAHQEAYCLASTFPVCPTFQDWARREAAAARPADEAASSARDEIPESTPLPPRELEPRHAAVVETPTPLPPRRNPPRDWAAPPPWAGEDGPRDDDWPLEDEDRPEPAADRRGSSGGEDSGAWGAAAAGLAGSSAYRLAGPDPDEPIPARPADPYPATADSYHRAADPYAEAADPYRSPPPGVGSAAPAPQRRAASRPSAPQARQAQPSRPEVHDPAELFGPAWERPRRYEAYPSLRTRVRLPSLGGISRLGVAAAALILAAVGLFFVGPMLLGIGSDNSGSGGGSTPLPSVEATATAAPTVPPAPTPQIYVVAKGDTLTKIAKKFGLTTDQVLAANPQIKNPNKIKVGDEITIPVPVQDEGGDGASTAP
jgi:LysM domain